MKKFAGRVLILTTTLLLFLANIASASACIWTHYQPEVPESLKK